MITDPRAAGGSVIPASRSPRCASIRRTGWGYAARTVGKIGTCHFLSTPPARSHFLTPEESTLIARGISPEIAWRIMASASHGAVDNYDVLIRHDQRQPLRGEDACLDAKAVHNDSSMRQQSSAAAALRPTLDVATSETPSDDFIRHGKAKRIGGTCKLSKSSSRSPLR